MASVEFKLKQASAVLGVPPKDLQNLVQLSVLRPRRRNNLYWFDTNLLLQAKIAFYLKDALGTSSELLGRFTAALSRNLKESQTSKTRYVSLRSRPARGNNPLEIKIPLRALAKELEEQLPLAAASKDLPKGRKRPGWKREMIHSMQAAASDLKNASEARILETIRRNRAERKNPPEISIAFRKEKTA